MSNLNDTYWTSVIDPKNTTSRLGLKELCRSKYLVWLFVKRDIIVQFKQTIFGMAWYFISPLFSVFMYMVVFGRIAGIPTDDVPQPMFYMSGVCLWEYFSTCLTDTSSTFAKNASLFGKVYFPRLVSPVSVIFSRLFRFAIQLLMFVIIYLFFVFAKGVHLCPNWYLLLFPVIVLILAGIALGLGLIVTSMTAKYKDLTNFMPVLISLWMYATPIVYPLSFVTNPTLHKLMVLNPVTAPIEAFKYGAYGAGSFSWEMFGYSFAFMVIVVLVGCKMYERKQKLFIDTI